MDYLQIDELEIVIYNICDYIKTHNKLFISSIQDLIIKARDIDISIKTHDELNYKRFIETDHCPARMGVFLLNSYGEFYFKGSKLTIYDDDPCCVKTPHINTYELEIKDEDTHDKFYAGNPTGQDEPYDFKAKLIKQITDFNGKQSDTTEKPWDSFHKHYDDVKRTIDFKSALWKHDNEHFTNYILTILNSGQIKLLSNNKKDNYLEKKFDIIVPASANIYYKKYLDLLLKLELLEPHTWDEFIL